MSPNFFIKIGSLVKMLSSFEKKISGKTGQRWKGSRDKRHGNNSDTIAKQFKMKVSIVQGTVNIKVIEYMEKKE